MLLGEIFGVDGIIVIVVVAVVLLFGGTALPKLARGLGSARHEFESGMREGDPSAATAPPDSPAAATAPPAALAPAPMPAPAPDGGLVNPAPAP